MPELLLEERLSFLGIPGKKRPEQQPAQANFGLHAEDALGRSAGLLLQMRTPLAASLRPQLQLKLEQKMDLEHASDTEENLLKDKHSFDLPTIL